MDSLLDMSGKEPRLIGGQCAQCGYVFFPHQKYGCERCGHYGSEISALPLSARGVVEVSTKVHFHADPRRPAPFVVAQVLLDGGPRVRALVEGDAELAAGTRVGGKLPPTVESSEAELNFRFVPLPDGQR